MRRVAAVLAAFAVVFAGLFVTTAPAQAATPKFSVTNHSGHKFTTSKGTIKNNKSKSGFTASTTITTGKYRFKFVRAGDGQAVSKCLQKNKKYRVGSGVAKNTGPYHWLIAVKC